MKVLIIEDDPMVAMIHQEYFKRKESTYEIEHVMSLSSAKEYLNSNTPELIILDNYLLDGQGIDLLNELKGYPVVMITAANDIQTVEKALSNGVIDYLVKPFTYERFVQAIDKVRGYVELLGKEKVSQDTLDDYLSANKETDDEMKLPKGLSKITLRKVLEDIKDRKEGFTTQQLADDIDISRITIRKYLNYLVNINVLSEDAEYYTSGRPVAVFNVISSQKIDSML